jgi:acetylglutamate kinase
MSKKTVRSRLTQGRLPVRVYKLGGPALEDPALLPLLAEELRRADANVVLVHGGGRRVDGVLGRFGIETRFVEGRRETSPAAMEVVEMVLAGSVNKRLAAELTRAGLPAVGLSGRDGALLRAEPVPGLGRVGTRVRVNPDAILALWSGGFVPVVAPISAGPDGGALNVNADEAALGIAMALFARGLVYLSDVEGVRVGDAPQSALSAELAIRLIQDGTIAGGMAMKVRTALAAATAGIPEVVIAGGARLTGGFPGTRVSAAATGAEARA